MLVSSDACGRSGHASRDSGGGFKCGGWHGRPIAYVDSHADGPLRAVFSGTAKAWIPAAPADRVATHEGQPWRPPPGEGTHPSAVPLAPDHRRGVDPLLHHDLLPHGALGRVRILALLRGPRGRLLRHVLRLDLFQRRGDGRRNDPAQWRRPDNLGRPEGRAGEHQAHRRVGLGDRDGRPHLAGDRRAIRFPRADHRGSSRRRVGHRYLPRRPGADLREDRAVGRREAKRISIATDVGEAAGGYFSLGAIIVLLALPALLAPLVGFVLGGVVGLVVGIGIAVVYWLILGLVGSAAQSILVTALYRYATTGKLGFGFPQDLLPARSPGAS